MLNDMQKYLINQVMQIQFFNEIEKLSDELQLMAYKATLSVPYYFEFIDTLRINNIESAVVEVGEMMSHPAPQNPSSFDENRIEGYCNTFLVPIVQGDSVDFIRKGIFNLIPYNDPEQPATKDDVSNYIKSKIASKISQLGQSWIDTTESVSMTDDPVQPELKPERQYVESYTYQSTINNTSLAEARLGKFDHYAQSPNANFYMLKGLRRIALGYGHEDMLPYFESDPLDLMRIAIDYNQNDRLKALLKSHGKEIPSLYANFLLEYYYKNDRFDTKVLLSLLNDTTITSDFAAAFAHKISPISEDFEYHFLCRILISDKYNSTLPLALAENLLLEANNRNNLSHKALILALSPNEFDKSTFFNDLSFITTIKEIKQKVAIKILPRLHEDGIISGITYFLAAMQLQNDNDQTPDEQPIDYVTATINGILRMFGTQEQVHENDTPAIEHESIQPSSDVRQNRPARPC